MSYAESDRSVETLRGMWSPDVAKALWETVRGHRRIQQAEVLFSVVRELKKCGWSPGQPVEGEKAQEIALRVVRGAEKSPCSPHRSEPSEQRSKELADALQVVPQLSSRDCETPWHRGSWEDGIPRVAVGVKRRVDRLRSLGNAVVPQQAYPIFKAIAELEGIGKGTE